MIVGLTGYAGSGKDALAGFLALHGFERVAFADKLRDLAYSIDRDVARVVDAHGWDTAKRNYPQVREFLQRLGVAVRQVLGPDTWVYAALSDLDPARAYVITDVRFPNEFEAVHARRGFVVRVERPGTGPVNGHVSETALDGIQADLALHNDGDLDSLASKATALYRHLSLRRTA